MRGINSLLTYSRIRKYLSRFIQCRHRSTAVEVAKNRGWEPVIGLEIHAQITSKSKLFSTAGTEYKAPVNSQVAFMDSALPGTLPVLNQRCVEAGVLTALALKSDINYESYFDRKHYFYADMPSGYQITQQRRPLAKSGHVTYLLDKTQRQARIIQLQLEQDSGKSLHDTNQHISLIDLNRAGVGLMEIVTEPDFTSGTDARAFVKELILILTLLETCRCKMEEGNLRVDASISLHKPNTPLGTRCEVKNLNSLGFLEKAIEYEINRQLDVLTEGGEVENETRMFLSDEGRTVPMRDKEKVHDYRFMPEPNLLPLRLYTNSTLPSEGDSSQNINVDLLKEWLPVDPMERRNRLVHDFQLSMLHANQIVNMPGYWELFYNLKKASERSTKHITSVLLKELAEVLKFSASYELNSEIPIKLEQLGDVIDLLLKECIINSELDVVKAIATRGLRLSRDATEMEAAVDEVLKESRDLEDKIKKTSGKKQQRYLSAVVKEVMRKSNNKYDAVLLLDIVTERFKDDK
ncbi:hypothetical protein LSH36_324g02007 [Paralvinella palmiformis]|uniref:Glutamyl-tRNA(Gln) amidotransferase subunit B, mitochondrial n=1 Tax=Paralvinella palmiformis TaxID=53620 RepID=A0AAD9JGA7_9ANNE|nr:hypothetical protein LSH36_324g02007 [Paralvinella palmiformis]